MESFEATRLQMQRKLRRHTLIHGALSVPTQVKVLLVAFILNLDTALFLNIPVKRDYFALCRNAMVKPVMIILTKIYEGGLSDIWHWGR